MQCLLKCTIYTSICPVFDHSYVNNNLNSILHYLPRPVFCRPGSPNTRSYALPVQALRLFKQQRIALCPCFCPAFTGAGRFGAPDTASGSRRTPMGG